MRGNFMEYIISVKWDNEARKWIATNDILPISAEAESFIELKEIVINMAREMVQLNNLPKANVMCFLFEDVREVIGA